jgi:hypothetical protein
MASKKQQLWTVLVFSVGFCLLLVTPVQPRSKRLTASPSQLFSNRGSFATPTQQNGHSHEMERIKKLFPRIDYDAPEPSDPVEKAKRQKKGKHYNNGYISKEPTKYSSGLVSEWDLDLPSLPVGESDAVLIGKTLAGGAFLSNDKTGVYTELSVRIEDALFGEDGSITKNKVVDVSRMGGVVRYANGEESLFHIVGQNMPKPGRRYLFFLKAIPESEDFEIITAYELGSSGVIALDTPGQFKKYDGMDEASFINAVRDAVAQQKKHG